MILNFLNSKSTSVLKIFEKEKPSKIVFSIIRNGLQRGFLNRLTQFFPTKIYNENIQRLDKVQCNVITEKNPSTYELVMYQFLTSNIIISRKKRTNK